MQAIDEIISLTPVKLDTFSRNDLKAYFENTWDLCEMLFSAISDDETLYIAPDPLRHPLIFYYGHTAAFYINKLRLAGWMKPVINARFEQLFAVGVDPEDPEELDNGVRWPTVDAVRAFRDQVKDAVLSLIGTMPLRPCGWDDPMWALLMGLEHDRIHFETSSMLMRQYPVTLLERPASWQYAPTDMAPRGGGFAEFNGQALIRLGRPAGTNTYGWDNEYGHLECEVGPFALRKNMVTNAEFLEFVRAGGYENPEWWTEDGWAWRIQEELTHPKFWEPTGAGYRYRAMFDLLPLPASWPAEVTAHEALAYCNWKGDGARLMSEAEWKLASSEAPEKDGDSIFAHAHNLNMAWGSPTPVGMMTAGRSASGVNDLYGNVWDWVANDFYPLPGFRKHPWYEDFSHPFFGPDHGMLLGGSWASTGTSGSKYYRLWFRRHFFQHAGFRLAKTL